MILRCFWAAHTEAVRTRGRCSVSGSCSVSRTSRANRRPLYVIEIINNNRKLLSASHCPVQAELTCALGTPAATFFRPFDISPQQTIHQARDAGREREVMRDEEASAEVRDAVRDV